MELSTCGSGQEMWGELDLERAFDGSMDGRSGDEVGDMRAID